MVSCIRFPLLSGLPAIFQIFFGFLTAFPHLGHLAAKFIFSSVVSSVLSSALSSLDLRLLRMYQTPTTTATTATTTITIITINMGSDKGTSEKSGACARLIVWKRVRPAGHVIVSFMALYPSLVTCLI